MKIIFRVDASSVIGTGHVMRCLTLAGWLREKGAQCQFICQEHAGNLLDLIRKQEFKAVGLPVAFLSAKAEHVGQENAFSLGDRWEDDASLTIAGLGGEKPDWLVVDNYALEESWELMLSQHCQHLMVIDDLANRNHICDILLDQNAIAGAELRYENKVPQECELLIGPRFSLLQRQYKEFRTTAKVRNGEIRRILVYFGGADLGNLTDLAVEALLALKRQDIAIDVVVDPMHSQFHSIALSVRGHQNFTLHGRLPSLAPLMQNADLFIGAGGTTSWERCCLGLPAIIITLAENQKPVAAELDRLEVLRWLGHEGEVGVIELRQALEDVIGANSSEQSQKALSLVDGLGVDRVGEFLMLSSKTHLQARRARQTDETLLLLWANNPLVRLNSFSMESISAQSHSDWFQKRLKTFGCRIYIIETEFRVPVGQVRFELCNDQWSIDFSIKSLFRGRGLGVSVLKTAINALRSEFGRPALIASVKDKNVASLKVFEALGFTHNAFDSHNGIHHFLSG